MTRRKALTLLEVVIGLVLMGTVLVASLAAFSRHRQQLATADKQLDAVAVADELIRQLSATPGGLRGGERGLVPGRANWIWQTSLVGQSNLATVPLEVIEFSIIEVDESPIQLVSVNLFQASGP